MFLNMNKEELRKLIQSGFEKLRPHMEGITISMMECYQQGFKDCWKALTGEDFEL
jgi:hypothetical protein